ncbi:MAG: type II toxin-antitoxin system RelE/ParE family toxin [Lutibacter sp.]|nr:type II toxin-antitoxin system RelE/ParE family toxin [Lutibacter sp.]MDP3358695.1 type II toxin-antitoxin system RelE/ParE family toxin [Lutibacter sp.]
MDITFANNKLKKIANDDRLAEKKLGKREAQLFKQRLDDLTAAQTLEDVRHLPGNYHELVKNRKGQWACNLVHPYRLIFEPHVNPIPTNKDGQYLWIEIKGIEIIEIEDYH